MTLKRLSIILIETITTVTIKQRKSRLIQIQSHHEIVDTEVQFRKNKTTDNDFKKRKIDAFQKLKKKKFSHDQRFYSITLSFANKNASNFLIFHFHANVRIHYHSLKT